MKIGIMGGTFNPIHNGHLMLGEAAYKLYHLDQIWFMPNGSPPHKNTVSMEADVKERVEMVRLAIEGKEEFRLEEYETLKKGVSYSYETMEFFKHKYNEDTFYFIIGADSLFSIEKWVHPERIFPTCTILAAYRDDVNTKEEMYRQINYLKSKYHADIELLCTPLIDISSSGLREEIKLGKSISHRVPYKVEEYIRKSHLYR